MASNNSKKKTRKIINQIKKIAFSSQGFPIFLSLAILAILFVIFRMGSVDLDYARLSVVKKIERAQQDNKELNAEKAKLLSVRSLQAMADKHSLKVPREDQIIVIP